MSENDRSKREAFTEPSDDTETPVGHDIEDVSDRRQNDDQDSSAQRTQRDAPDTQNEETITRTSRGNGPSEPRTDQSGNLSETGSGNSQESAPTPARRQLPGNPPGCLRTAGSLVLMTVSTVSSVAFISKITKRYR